MYGLPQRYFVPARIRASYKPRLESAGLWSLPPEPEKKSFNGKAEQAREKAKESYSQAFEKEKVCFHRCHFTSGSLNRTKIQDKAKEVMGIYARLLEGKQFVFQGR
jgi:sorting and assembly machinery component 37